MPSPSDVIALAKLAEAASPEVATLTAKIATSLPEIFGPTGQQVVRMLSAAPQEQVVLADVVKAFQFNLGKYGLPETATPSQLYASARMVEPEIRGTAVSGRHFAGQKEIHLYDGSILSLSRGSGRSGVAETVTFQTHNKSAGLVEGHSSFFGNAEDTIGFFTRGMRAEMDLARTVTPRFLGWSKVG
jgi:hypothetical protein